MRGVEALVRAVRAELLALVGAVQFLTVLPLRRSWALTAADFGRAAAYYPAVGLALGALLRALGAFAGAVWPRPLAQAVLLAAWVGLTGALHLDGFLDLCDGLFGGRDAAARLRIMRDERLGAFAFAGGSLLLLLKLSALSAEPAGRGVLLAPALGRSAMVLAIVSFPYARKEGLGLAVKLGTSWERAGVAALTGLGASLLALGWLGLLAFALAVILALALGRWLQAKLGGLTGDCYGAICEVVELAVLLFAAAVA